MVKPVAKAEISSFVKGLITEASPLNFPPDATIDEENYNLNRDGSRDRRLGIDFEADHTLRSTGFTATSLKDVAHSTYKWIGAGNNTENEFIVVQFGARVDIFDSSKASISTDGFIGSVSLTGVLNTIRLSYASVDGTLVIAAETEEIHIIKYDGASLAYSTKRLLVRDQWGLPDDDNNDLNKRPTTLTQGHLYNLRNQGWGIPRKNSAGTLIDPISLFFTTYAKYPANSESVYIGLQFQPVTAGVTFERIYPNLYDDALGLDAPASKGYFIIDALKRGVSRIEADVANRTKFTTLSARAVTTLPVDTTTKGARVVADYAGRVFYAGFNGEVTDGDVNSPILSSYLLFSQLVKGQEDIVKCYQRGDPTSRESSDVVDTDGGVIRISGAKKIYGMVTQAGNLFVIADNGVWIVQGGSDYGFSATNYSVNKLSSFGCNNTRSIVTVNDRIFFFGESGIYSIAKNQYGDWLVSNISETTIQTLYDDIDTRGKENATGIYDASDKKVRWLYRQDLDTTNTNTVFEIVLDVQLNAFSKTRFYSLATDTPEVISHIQSASFISGSNQENVVHDTVDVVVDGVQVVINMSTRTSGIQSIKYVTLYGMAGSNVGYTFSQYRDTTFMDWKTADSVGVDAKAFMLTGVVTAGDSSAEKQSPYLVMHFLRTETGVEESAGGLIPLSQSSCLIRSQWDWANSVNSGKWSDLFQAYRYRRAYFISSPSDLYDNGYETVTTKNKLRGRGRALSLYMETEPSKDCRILGWNLSLTGNK